VDVLRPLWPPRRLPTPSRSSSTSTTPTKFSATQKSGKSTTCTERKRSRCVRFGRTAAAPLTARRSRAEAVAADDVSSSLSTCPPAVDPR
jgi:hypothetical protein